MCLIIMPLLYTSMVLHSHLVIDAYSFGRENELSREKTQNCTAFSIVKGFLCSACIYLIVYITADVPVVTMRIVLNRDNILN